VQRAALDYRARLQAEKEESKALEALEHVRLL